MELAETAARDPEIREALAAIEAWGLTAKLGAASVTIYAQNGLRLIELFDKPQILFFAHEMGYIAAPDPSVLPSATIARLEADLAAERARRAAAEAERDQLRQRVAALDRQLKRFTAAHGAPDERYLKLRTFLAKEFHPDYASGAAAERQVRTEAFKIFWPKIEDLDKS